MELNSETKRILSLVQKTGREIEMVADPSLQVLAKTKMATGKLTAHVVVYNPNKKAVDYRGNSRARDTSKGARQIYR